MTIDARVQLHPLNEAFAWERHEPPFRRISPAQAAAYDDDGFFVLEDAFDPDELLAVLAEIDPREAELEDLLRQADGGRVFIARADEITFTTHLAKQSTVLRDFVSGPVFRDLTFDLIGPDVRLYWDQAVYKKPGTDDPFPWHQDNGYTFIEPQQYLTCWVALTDATVDNGCPWVVPGLHRLGTLAHEASDLGFVCLREAEDAIAVPARAGSIVVFSSLTPHSTGPNHSDGVRKAYIVQYAPDGAEIVVGGGPGQPSTRVPAVEPDRQFFVLRDGEAV